MTKLRPLADRLLVKPIQDSETTSAGLLLPPSVTSTGKVTYHGRVMDRGPGKRTSKDVLIPGTALPGDRVLYGRYSGTEFKIDGETIIMIKDDDVIAIVDEWTGQPSDVVAANIQERFDIQEKATYHYEGRGKDGEQGDPIAVFHTQDEARAASTLLQPADNGNVIGQGQNVSPHSVMQLPKGQDSTAGQHRWSDDGESCVRCGDKDWMGGECHPRSDDEGVVHGVMHGGGLPIAQIPKPTPPQIAGTIVETNASREVSLEARQIDKGPVHAKGQQLGVDSIERPRPEGQDDDQKGLQFGLAVLRVQRGLAADHYTSIADVDLTLLEAGADAEKYIGRYTVFARELERRKALMASRSKDLLAAMQEGIEQTASREVSPAVAEAWAERMDAAVMKEYVEGQGVALSAEQGEVERESGYVPPGVTVETDRGADCAMPAAPQLASLSHLKDCVSAGARMVTLLESADAGPLGQVEAAELLRIVDNLDAGGPAADDDVPFYSVPIPARFGMNKPAIPGAFWTGPGRLTIETSPGVSYVINCYDNRKRSLCDALTPEAVKTYLCGLPPCAGDAQVRNKAVRDFAQFLVERHDPSIGLEHTLQWLSQGSEEPVRVVEYASFKDELLHRETVNGQARAVRREMTRCGFSLDRLKTNAYEKWLYELAQVEDHLRTHGFEFSHGRIVDLASGYHKCKRAVLAHYMAVRAELRDFVETMVYDD